jgi:hypothetical protein
VAGRASTRPTADDVRARLRALRGVLGLWLVATVSYATIAALMLRAGVPGWDAAAHLYKAFLVDQGQSMVWDNLWYGGSYGSVTYGVVYYWLVQYVPAVLVVVVAAGAIPPLYYIYQRRMWGIDDYWPAALFAVVMGIYLAHGQDPFVLSLALSLAGLALLACGWPVWAALPVAVGIFVNPMGFVVAGVLMLADVVARPACRRRYLWFFISLSPVVVLRFLLGWAFPEPSAYLNETSQMLVYLGFALAGVALAGVNAVHSRGPFVVLFLVYAALCLASFVIPHSPLGNNVGRFFMVFGVPLMVLLRHSRLSRPFRHGELAIIPIVLFALLQFGTPLDHFFSNDDLPQTEARFFAPALAVAQARSDANHRLHIVALRRHWEAYYFPRAGYAITRGWYRQADAIHNWLFYTQYDAADYAAWLRRMGVEYVFLADAPLDPWSEREARLLVSSSEFEAVETAGAWTIYRVARPEGLAVGLDGGVAKVTSLGHRSFSVTVEEPGSYLVKVTWSPYWRLYGQGRLVAGRDRFMRLEAVEAGTYTVVLDATPRKALAQVWKRAGG